MDGVPASHATAMHAVIASVGTDGDVFPFIGLGDRLRARGHRVTLVSNAHYQPLAAAHGLGFRAMVSDEDTHAFISNPDLWHPLKGPGFVARWGASLLGAHYRLIAELAADRDAVLVASLGVLAARLVREKLRRPLASVVLQPWMIASIDASPVMPAGLTLPPWAPRPLGRLYYRLIDVAGDLLIGPDLQHVRARLRLPPVPRIFRWWYSPDLVLGLFPDWYGPPQADWPPRTFAVGFPRFDLRTGPLPGDVRAFCRSGQPPVAFTFGTGMMHGQRYFRAALEALRHFGGRGLFLTRYGGQLPAPLPPFVRHCEFAPFAELFPLCAAVVHHGGIGTTARALAAGVPQLVLPLAYDQPDNAARVKRLGVGDRLRPRRATGPSLARALAGLKTPGVRERCRAVAEQCGQDGLEEAAVRLEALADRRSATIR
jgi:rhamnosyltransferase subunit B